MFRRTSMSLLMTLAVSTTGCLSVATFQTADTNGRGKTQFALEGSSTGIATSSGRASLPGTNISARYGITDDVDVGARIGSVGGELMAKVRLFGAPGQTSMALAPSVGGISFGGASLMSAQLPLLIGLPVGSHQLVLSPKVHMYRASANADATTDTGGTVSTSASATLVSAGAGVAFALKLGESFRIVPELSMIYPLFVTASAAAGNESTTGSSMVNANGAIYQVGVGLLFGGN